MHKAEECLQLINWCEWTLRGLEKERDIRLAQIEKVRDLCTDGSYDHIVSDDMMAVNYQQLFDELFHIANNIYACAQAEEKASSLYRELTRDYWTDDIPF